MNPLQEEHDHHRRALENRILRAEPGTTTFTYFGGHTPWDPFHCSFEEDDLELQLELHHFLEVTKPLPLDSHKYL